MNIDFEAEFVHDLESFVRDPIQIEPAETWNPRQVAAPERHFMLGTVANKSVDLQIYMLRDNCAFQDIESLLHISFHAVDYAECTKIHPVKEQVWLFGYRWLEKYLAFLAKSGSMKNEFYRRQNDRFLELLGGCLVYNPDERITFYDALRFWNPQHTAVTAPAAAPGITAKTRAAVSNAGVELPIAAPVVTNVVASGEDRPTPIQPSETIATSYTGDGDPRPAPRRRLNLIRLYDSVGRTKTRKACNSTHSPASDNHGWITRD